LSTDVQDKAWPTPTIFVFDLTSTFYLQIKEAVEAKFPNVKPSRPVGYIPYSVSAFMQSVSFLDLLDFG
jgi:hypothetical protein